MIDLTKNYKTEFGHPVMLIGDKGPISDFPIVGYLAGETKILFWDINGIYNYQGGNGVHWPLVEGKDKIIIERWFNFYCSSNGAITIFSFHNEIDANNMVTDNPIKELIGKALYVKWEL